MILSNIVLFLKENFLKINILYEKIISNNSYLEEIDLKQDKNINIVYLFNFSN